MKHIKLDHLIWIVLITVIVISLFSCQAPGATVSESACNVTGDCVKLDSSLPIDTTGGVPIIECTFYIAADPESFETLSDYSITAIKELNDRFQGSIQFTKSEFDYRIDPTYDIRYFFDEISVFDELASYFSNTGVVNVYVFNPDPEDVLLGFTKVWYDNPGHYELVTPEFDDIAMSTIAYMDETLVHEMGHYLGLKDMINTSDEEKHVFGVTNNKLECVNAMGYGCCGTEFTKDQIDYMTRYAIKYRNYVIK